MTKSRRAFFRKKKVADARTAIRAVRATPSPKGVGTSTDHVLAGIFDTGAFPIESVPVPNLCTWKAFSSLRANSDLWLSEDPRLGDVLVQGPSLRRAMGGDRVRARVTSMPEAPRRSGEITEVLVHAIKPWWEPSADGEHGRGRAEDEGALVRLVDLQNFTPRVGDIVVARIRTWATAKTRPPAF